MAEPAGERAESAEERAEPAEEETVERLRVKEGFVCCSPGCRLRPLILPAAAETLGVEVRQKTKNVNIGVCAKRLV